MIKFVTLLFLLICFGITAFCGRIVYPWRATTAIVKSGERFEVWFNADSGQTVHSIELKGPYHTVSTGISTVTGNWVYDLISGNTFTHKITVSVPTDIPADRYDLVLNTSTGKVTSYGGVKVVQKYKEDYYLVHMSDGHLFQGGYDSDVLLKRKSAMIDIANIIDAQIIIETGDNMYNVINHPERETYYFLGNDSIQTKGMAKATAATFLIPGNHDGPIGNDFKKATAQQNADFFNQYWGMQNHSFKYGNGRFMNINNSWAVTATSAGDHQYQIDEALAWLQGDGAGGNFHLSAGHGYNKMHNFIEAGKDLSLVISGHNHHLFIKNPYSFAEGSPAVAYIAGSIREYFVFNLFKINNSNGTFTTPSGTTASTEVLFSGTRDAPSTWVTNLQLTYTEANNGTNGSNTATIDNKFPFTIEGAKVRFIMPMGRKYKVSKGKIEQAFDGTSVHVVDVLIDLNPNSTTQINIH
jgi:hypothetical protein